MTQAAQDGVRTVVPEWENTTTSESLQELIVLAETVVPVVARRAGLSGSELQAMRHLVAGPIGPVELARRLNVTSAAASGMVDRLVAHGHVTRTPHPDDGRRTAVVVTPSGRAELFTLLQPMFGALSELDRALSDADRAVVDRYLRGAVDAIRTVM